MRGKIHYCPVCGKELLKITGAGGVELYSVCKDSACRTMIKNNNISEMDIEIYSRLQDKLLDKEIRKSTEQFQDYMLLKENMKGALMSLLTNQPSENRKVVYNIVTAKSHNDAVALFNSKFKYTSIKPERVVRVQVKIDD